MSRLAAFKPSDFATDHLHMSDSGYRKMAGVWFATLNGVTRK
jgi:lysophospholipase L1-like esterase